MTVGETLKHLRTSQGLTIKEVAYLSGYNESSIKRYETNVNVPSYDALCSILDALGYELSIERKQHE